MCPTRPHMGGEPLSGPANGGPKIVEPGSPGAPLGGPGDLPGPGPGESRGSRMLSGPNVPTRGEASHPGANKSDQKGPGRPEGPIPSPARVSNPPNWTQGRWDSGPHPFPGTPGGTQGSLGPRGIQPAPKPCRGERQLTLGTDRAKNLGENGTAPNPVGGGPLTGPPSALFRPPEPNPWWKSTGPTLTGSERMALTRAPNPGPRRPTRNSPLGARGLNPPGTGPLIEFPPAYPKPFP